jgi:hypothetical protein
MTEERRKENDEGYSFCQDWGEPRSLKLTVKSLAYAQKGKTRRGKDSHDGLNASE